MSVQHPLSNELSFQFFNFHKCDQLSLTLFHFSKMSMWKFVTRGKGRPEKRKQTNDEKLAQSKEYEQKK